MVKPVLKTTERFEDALVNTMMDACESTAPKEVTAAITDAALQTAQLRRKDESSAEYKASLAKLKRLL